MADWVAGRSDSLGATARGFANLGRQEGGMEGWGWRGGIYEAAQWGGTTAVLGPSTVKQVRRVDQMVILVGSRRALRSSLDRCASPFMPDTVKLFHQCTAPTVPPPMHLHSCPKKQRSPPATESLTLPGSTPQSGCCWSAQQCRRVSSAVSSHTYPTPPIRLALHRATTDSSRVGRWTG